MKILIPAFLCLIMTLMACEHQSNKELRLEIEDIKEVLYFNSFETEEDLSSIEGLGHGQQEGTLKDGGAFSLLVNGGCVGPHCIIDVGPFEEAMDIKVSFWAKTDITNGGAMNIFSKNQSDLNHVESIMVENVDWAYYETEESIHIPKDQSISLNIMSGGLISVNTSLDLLKVEIDK